MKNLRKNIFRIRSLPFNEICFISARASNDRRGRCTTNTVKVDSLKLSCIVLERIIIIISRVEQSHPGRILSRACPESTLQNLENFISARARNTRPGVGVFPRVLLIFRLKEEEHRHSAIRATSLSVKFDAETQDARKIPHPFAVFFCERKKMARPSVRNRRSLIVVDWQSPVFTRPRGQSGYQWLESQPPPLPSSSRFDAFTLTVFVHIESTTRFPPSGGSRRI